MSLTIQTADAAEPGERPYRPYGAARELMRCTAREVVLSGPAGTGKSRACLEKLNLVCMQLPIRAAMVRKVRRSLTQWAMVTLEQKVLAERGAEGFEGGEQGSRFRSREEEGGAELE